MLEQKVRRFICVCVKRNECLFCMRMLEDISCVMPIFLFVLLIALVDCDYIKHRVTFKSSNQTGKHKV